jgi:hypothetical protein
MNVICVFIYVVDVCDRFHLLEKDKLLYLCELLNCPGFFRLSARSARQIPETL